MIYHKSNNLRFLKFLVYSMSIVLMLGIVLIIYAIFHPNHAMLKNFYELAESKKVVCENLSAKIILGSEIQDMKEANGKLILLTSEESGMQQIIIFDYCRNKIINDLYVEIKDKRVKRNEEANSNFDIR